MDLDWFSFRDIDGVGRKRPANRFSTPTSVTITKKRQKPQKWEFFQHRQLNSPWNRWNCQRDSSPNEALWWHSFASKAFSVSPEKPDKVVKTTTWEDANHCSQLSTQFLLVNWSRLFNIIRAQRWTHNFVIYDANQRVLSAFVPRPPTRSPAKSQKGFSFSLCAHSAAGGESYRAGEISRGAA